MGFLGCLVGLVFGTCHQYGSSVHHFGANQSASRLLVGSSVCLWCDFERCHRDCDLYFHFGSVGGVVQLGRTLVLHRGWSHFGGIWDYDVLYEG